MEKTSIDEMYPKHIKALEAASLILKEYDDSKKSTVKKKKNRRRVYFCIGTCDVWRLNRGKPPIHKVIDKLKSKYKLK